MFERWPNLKATTAQTTRTRRMMTKATMASTTNTIGSRVCSWFSLLSWLSWVVFFTSNWVWYSSEVEWSQISSNGVKLDKYVCKIPKKRYWPLLSGHQSVDREGCWQWSLPKVSNLRSTGPNTWMYDVFKQFWFCFQYERWPGLSNNQFFKVMVPGKKTVSKFLNCEELRIFELKSSTFLFG